MKRMPSLLLWLGATMFAQVTQIASVPLVGIDGWSDLKANWDKNEVYVTHNHAIDVIDANSWQIKSTLPLLSLAMSGMGMCPSPITGLIATIYPTSETVVIIDPVSGATVVQIKTGLVGPTNCSFSANGDTLYVSSGLQGFPGRAKLVAINTSSWLVVRTWLTGESSAHAVRTSPNGKIYVLTQDASAYPLVTGDLRVIGTDRNMRAVDLGLLPQFPRSINIASNGRVYIVGVSIGTNGNPVWNTIVVDPESDQIIDKLGASGWSVFASPYLAFPSEDPWFCYNVWPSNLLGINIAQKVSVVSGQIGQKTTYGMLAHRQTDGSDVIVLLRDGYLDVFGATQPPTLYSAVNGGSFKEGPVAPGEIVSLFGAKLGTETTTFSTVPLPTQLGGVSVVMNGGVSIPPYYTSPTQINVQIPYEVVSDDKVTLQVVTPQGNTNSVTVPLAQSAPAPFAGPNGEVLVDLTGHWTKASAIAGQVAMMFATGLGQVNPPVPTGAAAPLSPISTVVGATTVTICGQPAQVLFSGLAPMFVSLYQINVVVPQECGDGRSEDAQITVN